MGYTKILLHIANSPLFLWIVLVIFSHLLFYRHNQRDIKRSNFSHEWICQNSIYTYITHLPHKRKLFKQYLKQKLNKELKFQWNSKDDNLLLYWCQILVKEKRTCPSRDSNDEFVITCWVICPKTLVCKLWTYFY